MDMPSEHTVHLWFASLQVDRDKALLATYLSWLSVCERAHYQSIGCVQQSNQYLLTRALVRGVFSNYVHTIEPQAWLFTTNIYGKPELDQSHDHFNISFNLSHSMDLVVLAVCKGIEVGVDVEEIQRPVFNFAMADHYFCSSEVNQLKALPEPQRKVQVAEIWTLKEAYLKALGLGMRIPLKRFSFSFEREGWVDVHFSPKLEDDAAVWRFCLLRLGLHYRVALALKSPLREQEYSVQINEWAAAPSELDYVLLRKNNFLLMHR
jgi:4'-phosphopantetheinyl transferase